jgi:hypothetical protein
MLYLKAITAWEDSIAARCKDPEKRALMRNMRAGNAL